LSYAHRVRHILEPPIPCVGLGAETEGFEVGAVFAIKLLGEAGFELLLSSHRLTPDVLIADGFRFEHPTASNAVRWAITD
jgi:NAD dependent epimerase/dehydratase family enzyme